MKVKGTPVPGLAEIIPSRSDYRHLVSYRTYRLEDCSQRFDPTIKAKLSSYAKRLKQSIEAKFSGDEPIYGIGVAPAVLTDLQRGSRPKSFGRRRSSETGALFPQRHGQGGLPRPNG
jgi:hypothetical protein